MGNLCKSQTAESAYRHDGLRKHHSVDDGKPIHAGPILGISATGGAVYTASEDKRIGKVSIQPDVPLGLEVKYFESHTKAVNKVDASAAAEKNIIWTASRDLSIKQWNDKTQTCTSTMNDAHELNISALVSNTASSELYSGSRDYFVKVWDTETAKMKASFSAPRNIVTTIETGADGGPLIYQGSEDLAVRVWDTRSNQKTPAVHVAGFVYFPLSLSLHQSGHLLASGCKGFEGVGSEVRIWDLRKLNGQSLIDFKYHNFDVSGCKFSKESPNTLYSASKDGSICAWSCASEEGTECAASPLSALPVTGKSFTCIDIPERSSGVLEASADTIETFFLGAFDGSLSEVSVLKSGGEGAFKLDVSRTSPQHAYEDEHDDGFGD